METSAARRHIASGHARRGGADLDLLRVYLNDLGRQELLDRTGEIRLAKAIDEGAAAQAALESVPTTRARATERRRLRAKVAAGQRARDEFAAANLRLVVSVAKGYQYRGVDLADLVQEGNIGLLRAIDRFDWRKGYKFSTYATWWIRKAVIQAISDARSPIHLPRRRREQARALADAAERLERDLGRRPDAAELARAAGVRESDMWALRRASAPVVSLSVPVGDDGSELSDVVPDLARDTGETALRSFVPAEIERLLSTLSAPAARVLRLRYGIDDGEPRTATSVAAIMKVSPERVRQIEMRALAVLRYRTSPDFRAS